MKSKSIHSAKTLKKSADILWSQIVKMRDRKCLITDCGSRENLNAHHIFSRSNTSTRFNLNNGFTLCYGHHSFFAHKYPGKFRNIVIERIGQDKYDELHRLSNMVCKCDITFLQDTIKNLHSSLIKL